MGYEFFIARRYLFSKKSHHAINIISAISACGVAIATMALVCILSVFNGFQDFVADLFTAFDPELEITLKEGAAFSADDPAVRKFYGNGNVKSIVRCVEGKALAVNGNLQVVVSVRGVDDSFFDQVDCSSLFFGTGEVMLHGDGYEYGILGAQLATNKMALQASFEQPITLYAPKKGERLNPQNPAASFTPGKLYSPGVVFQMDQSKYDANYILTSLPFAQRLLDRRGEVTALHVYLKETADLGSTKREIQDTLGERFEVKDRYQQQEDIFHIMNIEKLIAYVFLSFILLVACFNIIGSLSMLMIDKKRDVETLRHLGATNRQICRIFMLEGRLISLAGALTGILLGVGLCLVQQYFGIITMGDAEGSFIRESYPVSIQAGDILLVFVTVLVVGWVAVWYPVRNLSRSLL